MGITEAMEIGRPRRIYRVEPVEDPVPQELPLEEVEDRRDDPERPEEVVAGAAPNE